MSGNSSHDKAVCHELGGRGKSNATDSATLEKETQRDTCGFGLSRIELVSNRQYHEANPMSSYRYPNGISRC